MRNFRRIIIDSSKESHQKLTKSKDFFSLSDLRDLIFHVQEHRFTIPHIAHCLEELGLKFCGFGNQDIISNFRVFNGKDANIYDLNLWHKYEESNPKTFIGMYQFWCQKLWGKLFAASNITKNKVRNFKTKSIKACQFSEQKIFKLLLFNV